MRDTTPEITQKICEMIQQKTPAERIIMGCSMYETSRHLIIRSILNEYPNISASEMLVELFNRFYGGDFDVDQREKIIQHLRMTNCRNRKS